MLYLRNIRYIANGQNTEMCIRNFNLSIENINIGIENLKQGLQGGSKDNITNKIRI